MYIHLTVSSLFFILYKIIFSVIFLILKSYNYPHQMSDASLVTTRAHVRDVLARYEARQAAPQRQRLVWRLSERTLKVNIPHE